MKKRLLSQILAMALCVVLTIPAYAAGSSFQDVPPAHWAYESVEFAVDRGLFKGTSATTFSPNATMTRAMLLEVLYRYAGSPAVSGTVRSETPFTDVPDQAYYEDAVVWAYQNELFPNWFLYQNFYNLGSEEDNILHSFQPNRVMCRFDFAVILRKFMSNVLDKPLDWDFLNSIEFDAYNCPLVDMRETGVNTALSTVYPEYGRGADDTISVYYALAWAYTTGIMNGTSATTMSPAADITRAQVAAMLMRFYGEYNAESVPETPDEKPDPVTDPSAPTLANGAAITEENVLALLEELKVKYPNGGHYDAYEEYFSYAFYSRATECAKLAFMLSDEIWGDLPVRTHTDITKIRPGDVIESPGSSHWAVAIARPRPELPEYGGEDCYCYWTVDGSPAGVIYWSDPNSGNCSNMYTYDGYIVHTRYPEGM